MIGAIVNAAAVLAGGSVGLLFKGKIKEDVSVNIIRVIGLCVIVIGVSGALSGDIMLLVISLTLGAFVGELINIDKALNDFGLYIQNKFKLGDENSNFARGFVTATLLFCVGAMAIVGSIESGIRGDRSIVFTKSILDAVTSIILASSLGFGVLASAVVILIYQGGIEFFASYLQYVLTDTLITQISAVGSVMILGIGLNMALKAEIKIANLLPGLLFAVGYYYLFLG